MSEHPLNRILVVDDDAFIVDLIEEQLSGHGYHIARAEDYDSALARVAEEEVHLVLCDVYLGGRNGIELLHALREQGQHCPVVMITGSPELKHATEALRLGAHDYLTKPLTPERLLRVTRGALAQYALKRENETMRARLEGVFRSVQDGIVTVDRQLRLLALNPAARRLCALASEAGEGSELGAVAHHCDHHCARHLTEVVESGRGMELKGQSCVIDGRERVYTLSINPLSGPDSGVEAGTESAGGAVMVIHDETRLRTLEDVLAQRRHYHRLVGASRPMQALYELIRKLGDTPVPVLVTGESGTGKELVAEALHRQWCGEGDSPLVRVNCAALSDELLESELFGHVKGAFTGALRDKPGRFELAHGGTILLDEIGDISPKMQSRLLRVLQEREVERVGGTRPVKVEFQLVAATNRDLQGRVRDGAFREDLYHRLKVVQLALAPLRERREDIPLLVEYFVEKLNRHFNRGVEGVTGAVQRRFMNYPWPGNVRELEHVLEHAFVVCEGARVDERDLPAELLGPASPAPSPAPTLAPAPPATDDAAERERILRLLELNRWNKSETAKALGIDRSTLYRKMRRLAIDA